MNEILLKIKKVFQNIMIKLSEALSSIHGWLLGIVIVLVNFFAGYHIVLYGILTAVSFDAFFGIWVALKQHKFILSELLRATLFKLMVYLNMIVISIFLDRFAGAGGMDTRITTMLIACAICLAETWSSCGNALIINPQFPFLRLMRKALTGEIARKLGIPPQQVETYLNPDKK